MARTIVLFGSNGTIGKAVAKHLHETGNTVIGVNRSSGDYQANIDDKASIQNVLDKIGKFDAIVNAAGNMAMGNIQDLTDEQFASSIASKLMGQVNLVRTSLPFIADNGSITLVSGILTNEPVPGGSIASLVNGGIEGFVKTAALEMPRGIRLNCVSPTILTESIPAFGPYMQGFVPVDADKVAIAYLRCIFGNINGRIIEANG